MRTRSDIKKLAWITFDKNAKLNPEVADYALSNLTRTELFHYLVLLKGQISRDFIVVYHGKVFPESIRKSLVKKFEDKNVLFREDDDIHDGIKISNNDTIMDLSFRSFVNTTLDNLKGI